MTLGKPIFLLLFVMWNADMALAQAAPQNPERQIQELLKKIRLDDEQKVKVRQIRESGRGHLQGLREDLEKKRKALDDALDANADDAVVREAFQNLQSTKSALEKARFERMLAIRAVLSEQQRSAFQNLRQQSRAALRLNGSSDQRRE